MVNMRLKQLSEQALCVREVAFRTDSTPPKAEIVLGGSTTGKLVPGAVLEAAIAADSSYVLFLTDGIPFEDMLTICYLDQDLAMMDQLRLGSMYSTGSFSDLQLAEPNRIHFRFIGGTTWTLELLSRKEPCLPFVCDPKGVWRRPAFSRRMKLEGSPQPAT